MIRTLRALFLARLFREKILLVAFAVLGVVMWFSGFSTRVGTFWREQRSTDAQKHRAAADGDCQAPRERPRNRIADRPEQQRDLGVQHEHRRSDRDESDAIAEHKRARGRTFFAAACAGSAMGVDGGVKRGGEHCDGETGDYGWENR